MGSNILGPGLHYIGAQAPIHWSPFISKTCFLFYFRTCITLNQRFPVHLIDPHVTHKTWFYHNFFFSFLSRILKIKFWGSNILEPGSNILKPPNVTDCQKLLMLKTVLKIALQLVFPVFFGSFVLMFLFFVLFLNMKHGKQNVSSSLVGPSCDTQKLVLSELSLLNPSQNFENKIQGLQYIGARLQYIGAPSSS